MRTRSLHPFVAGVRTTVRCRKLFGAADHVIVALSAGPDSTALLAALAALRDAGELSALSAAHVDHGLRAGAVQDAEAAAESCRRLAVPLGLLRVSVPPGNVQAEARSVRYRALKEAALRAGASRIATGHTRTDQAETVLLRLLRGAGARGLAGIPPRRGPIVRPLLDRSRAEVLAFLESQGLPFREDPTNASPRFSRNRVRHELVPVLAALAPSAERAIARSADLLRADERALSARARAAVRDGRAEDARLRSEPAAVRGRIVRRLWQAASQGGELGAEHVAAVLRRLRRGGEWRLALPGRVELRHRAAHLEAVGAGPSIAEPTLAPLHIAGPGRYELSGSAVVVRIDARRPDLLPWPLVLRTRRPGDRFRPDGGAGGKKLKAWLIDRKISRERRDRLLLLAHGATVLAIPELGVLAQAAGPNGAGLDIQVEA